MGLVPQCPTFCFDLQQISELVSLFANEVAHPQSVLIFLEKSKSY